MPNNTINVSFDLLKLQGAKKITAKDGKPYIAICIPESRIKVFNRKDGSESLFLELDIKSNRDGEDKFGKTHFCSEATTKEERANKVKMPIIGNGKEFIFNSGGGGSKPAPRPAKQESFVEDTGDDTSIPF
jgi:hypothetical protein